jgi:hypothetical protein
VFLVIATAVLFAVQLPFVYLFNGKGFAFVNACILVAGYWFWCQANVFNWNMGEYPKVYAFSRFVHLGALELGVWLVVAVLTVVFFRFLFRYSIQFAFILAAAQIVIVAPLCFKNTSTAHLLKPNFAEYEITYNNFFDYSQDNDVYVFVLDGFGSTIFDIILTEVPYHEKFKDFTYFPKHYTPTASTNQVIPMVLSGMCMDQVNVIRSNGQETLYHAVFSQKTLFDVLTENGYECRVHAWVKNCLHWNSQSIRNIRMTSDRSIGFRNLFTQQARSQMGKFVGITAFRLMPMGLKWLYRHELLDGQFLISKKHRERILNSEYMPLYISICDERFYQKSHSVPWNSTPTRQFRFIHLEGPHTHGVQVTADSGFTSRQGKESLDRIHSFLERLKERNGYDNSLIIIMADHGIRGNSDVGARFIEANPAAPNEPLLLVKRPKDTHDTMQINDNPVTISDTKNAILTVLDLPRPDDAFCWFDVPEKLVEQRNIKWSDFLNRKIKAGITIHP